MKLAKLLLLMGLSWTLVACNTNSNSTDNQQATAQAQSIDPDLQNCLEQFYDNQPPVVSAQLAQNTKSLCFNGFAVLYSGMAKTPIWSAEYLTRQRLTHARQLPRVDNFHEEERLPKEYRSTLRDYRGSGYDRGHLAPNGDMSNTDAQYDSFSLANIAPQNQTHNRGVWQKLESQTRDLAQKHQKAYVVTGVAFLAKNVKKINNNVFIPSHFFKAIYIPSTGEATAYLSLNDASEHMQQMTLTELYQQTGIDAFPSLPQSVKDKKTTLIKN